MTLARQERRSRQPEPPARELPEAPPPRVARAYDNLEQTPNREPPIIQQTDRGVPIRDAAEAVAKWRSEGDEALQKQLSEYTDEDRLRQTLEADDDLRNNILEGVEQQERANVRSTRLLRPSRRGCAARARERSAACRK